MYKAVAVGEKTVDAHKTGARNKKRIWKEDEVYILQYYMKSWLPKNVTINIYSIYFNNRRDTAETGI